MFLPFSPRLSTTRRPFSWGCRRNGRESPIPWSFTSIYQCSLAKGTIIPNALKRLWIASCASLFRCTDSQERLRSQLFGRPSLPGAVPRSHRTWSPKPRFPGLPRALCPTETAKGKRSPWNREISGVAYRLDCCSFCKSWSCGWKSCWDCWPLWSTRSVK